MRRQDKRKSVLVIYTGGTIGMVQNSQKVFEPFNFKQIETKIPELKRFDCKVDTIQFENPLDSSNIEPSDWVKMAQIVFDNYCKYVGFVILHGTDTMAYSASALSFMLENLHKPVIFTGAQLPIGIPRSDGREHLLTAIELASAEQNSEPMVPEVCVYFEKKLYRGNRVTKNSAEYFDAFRSFNYPILAQVGVHIKYHAESISYIPLTREFKIHTELDTNIGILRIFPGITLDMVQTVTQSKEMKALIIETYGAGNSPSHDWFIDEIKELIRRNVVVVNVTQCNSGTVEMRRYKTGNALLDAGVQSGYDITIESAITKLMYLLGKKLCHGEIVTALNTPIIGEITIPMV